MKESTAGLKPPTLARVMSESDEVKLLVKLTEKSVRVIDVEKSLTEARFAHGQRPARKLHSKTLTISALSEANNEEVRVRSRLVELHAGMTRQASSLDAAVNSVQEFLLHKHRARLQELYSTEAARKRAVNQIVSPASEFVDELKSAAVEVAAYIQDIDKVSYAIRNNVDLLKMSLSPTKSIVE